MTAYRRVDGAVTARELAEELLKVAGIDARGVPEFGGVGSMESLESMLGERLGVFTQGLDEPAVILTVKRTPVSREELLPKSWTDLEEIFLSLSERALVVPGGIYVGDSIEKASGRAVTRTSSSQVETRGPAKGSRKSGGSKDYIRDPRALSFKRKVEGKLRALRREILVFLEDSGKTTADDVRRCTVCHKYGESTWVYCPRDGKPMESV